MENPIQKTENFFESLFRHRFETKSVKILLESEAEITGAPTCLMRLKNNKLVVACKDSSGVMKPFFVNAIETGFWDTRNRNADWEKVFGNYRVLGANTVFMMIHWSDIEPEAGIYDYSFTDRMETIARKYGLKIFWALFMHTQSNMPAEAEVDRNKFWAYHLDDKDGVNHAIQWPKDQSGEIVNTVFALKEKGYEITPCYFHPTVYEYISKMLANFATRYKDSDVVIGIQIGNEEGFNFNGLDSDFNPLTQKLFEKWKSIIGGVDPVEFKKDVVNRMWQRFSTMFHNYDPYQINKVCPYYTMKVFLTPSPTPSNSPFLQEFFI